MFLDGMNIFMFLINISIIFKLFFINKIDAKIESVMAALAHSHGLNVCVVDNLVPSLLPWQ